MEKRDTAKLLDRILTVVIVVAICAAGFAAFGTIIVDKSRAYLHWIRTGEMSYQIIPEQPYGPEHSTTADAP